jgi:hypothetical protein
LGIVAGLQLVGIPAVTVAETEAALIGAITPWIGVLTFEFGVLLKGRIVVRRRGNTR